jgi:hypothetical protein
VRDIRRWRRFRAVEQLFPMERKPIGQLIDAFLGRKKGRGKEVGDGSAEYGLRRPRSYRLAELFGEKNTPSLWVQFIGR